MSEILDAADQLDFYRVFFIVCDIILCTAVFRDQPSISLVLRAEKSMIWIQLE